MTFPRCRCVCLPSLPDFLGFSLFLKRKRFSRLSSWMEMLKQQPGWARGTALKPRADGSLSHSSHPINWPGQRAGLEILPCPRRAPEKMSFPYPGTEAVGRMGKVSWCSLAPRRASCSRETGCERRIVGRRSDKVES